MHHLSDQRYPCSSYQHLVSVVKEYVCDCDCPRLCRFQTSKTRTIGVHGIIPTTKFPSPPMTHKMQQDLVPTLSVQPVMQLPASLRALSVSWLPTQRLLLRPVIMVPHPLLNQRQVLGIARQLQGNEGCKQLRMMKRPVDVRLMIGERWFTEPNRPQLGVRHQCKIRRLILVIIMRMTLHWRKHKQDKDGRQIQSLMWTPCCGKK